MTWAPLFVLGTARSGTTLVAKMLDAHPRLSVASDPFFMLFRMFRNTAVAADMRVSKGRFDPQAPLQDYYFHDDQLAVMRAVLDGSMDLPCDTAHWDASLEQRAIRMGYECPDLVPLLPQMRGTTFRELLLSGLRLIAAGRSNMSAAYVGVKEVWLIEYVLPLLRAWPNARFVIITRDPRGVVASMLHMKDVSAHAHVLSYLRHWRKFAAFLAYYEALGLLGSSIFHVRFEDFVREPEGHCADLCRFLGVDMAEEMLLPERLVDYATGKPWKGNASSGVAASGVSATFADTWRLTLSPQAVALCEYIAGPDMELCAYSSVYPSGSGFPVDEALRCAMEDECRQHSWRSDGGDVQSEFRHEAFRRSLLNGEPRDPGTAIIQRAFLFDAAWRALQSGSRIACNAIRT